MVCTLYNNKQAGGASDKTTTTLRGDCGALWNDQSFIFSSSLLIDHFRSPALSPPISRRYFLQLHWRFEVSIYPVIIIIFYFHFLCKNWPPRSSSAFGGKSIFVIVLYFRRFGRFIKFENCNTSNYCVFLLLYMHWGCIEIRTGDLRVMAVSDNARGLILAMLSSLFIGTSFILKKKGLKRAAAAGTRAGPSWISSFSLIKIPSWLIFIYLIVELSYICFPLPNICCRCWRLFLLARTSLVGWHDY